MNDTPLMMQLITSAIDDLEKQKGVCRLIMFQLDDYNDFHQLINQAQFYIIDRVIETSDIG